MALVHAWQKCWGSSDFVTEVMAPSLAQLKIRMIGCSSSKPSLIRQLHWSHLNPQVIIRPLLSVFGGKSRRNL